MPSSSSETTQNGLLFLEASARTVQNVKEANLSSSVGKEFLKKNDKNIVVVVNGDEANPTITAGNESLKKKKVIKNKILVSNNKKYLYFYINLAKKHMQILTMLSSLHWTWLFLLSSKFLKRSGLTVEKKITISTFEWHSIEHMAGVDVFLNSRFELLVETITAGDEIATDFTPLTQGEKEDQKQEIEEIEVEKDPFAASDSHNLKYMGIDALSRFLKISLEIAEQHQLAVIDYLEDPDDTLKRIEALKFSKLWLNPRFGLSSVCPIISFLLLVPPIFIFDLCDGESPFGFEIFQNGFVWYLFPGCSSSRMKDGI